MLLGNSTVLIDRDGTSVRADRLETVRTIHDPVSGQDDEITDILRREIHLEDGVWQKFMPIRLPLRAGGGADARQAIVSPRQGLWDQRREAPGDDGEARWLLPAQLGTPCWELRDKTVTYVAIFFARRRSILSGGHLLRGYVIDDLYARPAAPVSERLRA